MKTGKTIIEKLEENFMAIAYAEAADICDFLRVLGIEEMRGSEDVQPEECQYGDNDLCYLES